MIPDSLARARSIRVPVFQRGTAPRVRVDALEEFMLVSAFHQGEMGEERLELLDELRDFETEWRAIPAEKWAPHRVGTTLGSIDEAKAAVMPALWETITDKRWQIKRLSEEIDRLERDATKVSRAYTMISGS